MIDSTVSNTINVLRARLESELDTPAVVLVTSAERGDGKSLVSFGLAETFAAARYRVLLIDANSGHPELLEVPRVNRIDPDADESSYPVRRLAGYDTLALTGASLGAETPRDAVRAMLMRLRLKYDVVVIDGGTLLESTLTTLFATYVDATLVALRLGRNATKNDTATAAALQRAGARVLGVVTAERSAIKAFANRLREDLGTSAQSVTTLPAIVPNSAPVRYAKTVSGDVQVSEAAVAVHR